MQIVWDSVHSGSGRTALPDNNTDYYPVPLSADTLRPGTVYADPYGHILMIVRRIGQTEDAAGIILAVDGQPNGTVARKRFWRGNFLFAQDPALGGPGFKRFRPVVVANGTMRRLTNAEIAKNPQYADFSLDQSQLGVEDFYDRMDDVMSPSPLDPTRAMKEAITSLEEQVKVRVTSVENGRKFQNSKRGEATMPDGPAIFETSSPSVSRRRLTRSVGYKSLKSKPRPRPSRPLPGRPLRQRRSEWTWSRSKTRLAAAPMIQLVLKRASASRPSGEWNEEDFDVLADGAVVGGIFKADAAPVGSPWL